MVTAVDTAYQDYLVGMVRLKLWFLWRWLRTHPEEDCRHALRTRVDIYRKTDINPEGINPKTLHWDDPRWQAIEDKIERLYTAHRDDTGAERFEDTAFAVLESHVTARALQPGDRTDLDAYTHGSVRFDPPAPGSSNAPTNSKHAANS